MNTTTETDRMSSDLPFEPTDRLKEAIHGPAELSMGPIEFAAFREDWRRSFRYRRYAETEAEKRLEERLFMASIRATSRKSFSSLRPFYEMEEDDEPVTKSRSSVTTPLLPIFADVVSRLLIGRAFDARPDLMQALQESAPVIVIDVPTRRPCRHPSARRRAICSSTSLSMS